MSVGKAILQIRQERGLTQHQVGRRARLATSYVSRIENNRVQPTMATLGRVARALDVPLSLIFQASEKGEDPAGHTCPVSASGRCIGEQIRSHRGRAPRGKKATASYGKEDLRLLKMTDYIVRRGSKDARKALAVVLESLMQRR
ncbi:MAG: helix-turn-helix domain-containing protein [Planctomycetota bacterium]|jgi:DNA-binding XRE family transcriptional regulator